MKPLAAFSISAALSLVTFASFPAAHADWITPYAGGSTADHFLRYSTDPSGSVTAPDAATALAGITYNNTPATGSGGGASLSAQGSAKVSLLNNPVLRANSRTAASSSGLQFEMVITGDIGEVTGVTPTIVFNGASTITGSNTWDSLASTSYRYAFDLSLHSSLLSGGTSLFNGLSLKITAGSETLYSATGLTTILGLPSILDTTYDNVAVEFAYNQADGPLKVEWAESASISAAQLSALGTGTSTLFTFRNAKVQVDAIPEPSTTVFLLVAGSLVGVGIQFRRRLRCR